MFFQRFYDERLAHASYLVGCQASGEAIVIDPARDTSAYHATAQEQKLRIVGVTETHIHADYLSGTRQLAHETGARMYLSDEGGPDWTYDFVGPNDQLLKMGTPSSSATSPSGSPHPRPTPEHLSFAHRPPRQFPAHRRFRGDFLFVGDVSRPDLLEKAAGMRYHTKRRPTALQLSRKVSQPPRPPANLASPGAGSACGKL